MISEKGKKPGKPLLIPACCRKALSRTWYRRENKKQKKQSLIIVLVWKGRDQGLGRPKWLEFALKRSREELENALRICRDLGVFEPYYVCEQKDITPQERTTNGCDSNVQLLHFTGLLAIYQKKKKTHKTS